MADAWDHVHSLQQEIRLPKLNIPLEAKHGTTQATLNIFTKTHVWPFSFPNVDTAENYPDCENDRTIEERIDVKENNAANEDC